MQVANLNARSTASNPALIDPFNRAAIASRPARRRASLRNAGGRGCQRLATADGSVDLDALGIDLADLELPDIDGDLRSFQERAGALFLVRVCSSRADAGEGRTCQGWNRTCVCARS